MYIIFSHEFEINSDNLTNVLSSYSSMNDWVKRNWVCVCVILKFWMVATNLREIKSCPYGKRFQRIAILIVLNKLHPYIWFFSISASLDPATSENETLKHATKYGCRELGNQGYTQLSYSFSIKQTSNLATGMILFKL